jgi:hypothetical protein
MTSFGEGALLVKKLLDESIPVVAYLVSSDRSSAKVRGFVDSFTSDVGLVVSALRGSPSTCDNLRLFFGPADNLAYDFGDEREFPGDSKDFVETYGNTMLTIRAISSGSIMVLCFNS